MEDAILEFWSQDGSVVPTVKKELVVCAHTEFYWINGYEMCKYTVLSVEGNFLVPFAKIWGAHQCFYGLCTLRCHKMFDS